MRAEDRTAVKAAIDRARRSHIQAQGGFRNVEKNAVAHTRQQNGRSDEIDIYKEALELAQAHVARLEAQVEDLQETCDQLLDTVRRHRVHVRGNWWHPEAQRLHHLGFNYCQIARRFGVHHTTVMYAVGKAGR